MSVRNVYHKTRDIVYKLNFTASGETLWSFIAEADGEIYSVESNNIASYTIAGGSRTLPFSITAGNSYSIAITKITEGQVADISLKVRRGIEKVTAKNVPDFGSFDGRYLYVLFDSPNEVKKIDTDLLTPANYSGLGTWVTNPVVATISLPVLPYSAIYKSITFVKNDGVEKMFLQGMAPDSFRVYGSFIKSDDVVCDLDEVNAGGYTTISNSTLIYNPGRNAVYDYINEIVYFPTSNGTNGWNGIAYDLVNKTSKVLGYGGFVSGIMSGAAVRQFQFIPEIERWANTFDISFVLERSYNYKNPQNSSGKACYILSKGLVGMQENVMGQIALYDNYGKWIGRLGYQNIGIYGVTEMACFDKLNTIFVVRSTNNKGALINYQLESTVFIDGVSLSSIMASNRNNLFFAITDTKRISIWNPSEASPFIGYVEFVNTPNQCHTNQLIV